MSWFTKASKGIKLASCRKKVPFVPVWNLSGAGPLNQNLRRPTSLRDGYWDLKSLCTLYTCTTYLPPHFSSNGRDLSFVFVLHAQQRCNFLDCDPAIWLSRREGLAPTQGDRHLVDNAVGNRVSSYVPILFLNRKPELHNLFARLVPSET